MAVVIPSEGIKAILAATSPNPLTGWAVTMGRMPTTPDKCITIYNGSGRKPEARLAIDYPTVQIVVRGEQKGYEAAYLKAKDIHQILHGILESNAAPYVGLKSCLAVSDVAEMGRDDNNRPLFTMNFDLITMPTISGTYDSREQM